MQIRHLISRFLSIAAQAGLILVFTTGLLQTASAAEFMGVDINSGKLLYIVAPKTVVTLANTGAKPDGVILGPYEQIIYALAGAGEVHSFNPYTKTDTTLATGLSTPVNIVLEPGCKSILVSDIGVNKIFESPFQTMRSLLSTTVRTRWKDWFTRLRPSFLPMTIS